MSKKSLYQAKEDLKRLQLEDSAKKEGVSIIDHDKYERNKKNVLALIFFLGILAIGFELLYFYYQGEYKQAVSRCYSYFRNLQGTQVLEICKELFR